MELCDFRAPAIRRSLAALLDLGFRLDSDAVEIGLRACYGFRPLALDGQAVALRVHTIDGWRDIRGHLAFSPAAPRHGTWYKYRFWPDKPHELFFVLEEGRCRWTNIRSLVFALAAQPLEFRNRLFKPLGSGRAAPVS